MRNPEKTSLMTTEIRSLIIRLVLVYTLSTLSLVIEFCWKIVIK